LEAQADRLLRKKVQVIWHYQEEEGEKKTGKRVNRDRYLVLKITDRKRRKSEKKNGDSTRQAKNQKKIRWGGRGEKKGVKRKKEEEKTKKKEKRD